MPRKYSQDQKDAAARMVADGHSIASVSEALGIPQRTLYGWVKPIDKDLRLDIIIQDMLANPTAAPYHQIDQLLEAQRKRNYVKMQRERQKFEQERLAFEQERLAFERQKWADAKALDPDPIAQKVRDGASYEDQVLAALEPAG